MLLPSYPPSLPSLVPLSLPSLPLLPLLPPLQISTFLKLLPVDGLWIDMNEISNFCSGECFSSQDENRIPYQSLSKSGTRTRLRRHGTKTKRVGFNPDSPPYAINNFNSKAPLNTKTLDMDATHLDRAVLEYNAHNLYGLSEARATSSALEGVKGTRSFVISRSTFPGSGAYTGHWTGEGGREGGREGGLEGGREGGEKREGGW